MPPISQVIMELRASGASLKNDLLGIQNSINRSMSGIEKSVVATFSPLQKMQTIAATVAGAGGIGLLINNAIKMGSEINDAANQIGIGTEALQELQYAAQQSGVETSALHQSLTILNRKAGEAAAGNAEATKTFKDLGIQVETANGKIRSTEDIFTDVIAKINETSSVAEKTRIAYETMGRGGAVILRMAADVEALRAKARDLGIVLDDAFIKRADEAGDSLDTLAKVISVNMTKAVLALAPEIVKLTELIAELGKGWRTVWDKFLKDSEAPVEELSQRAADLGMQIDELRKKLGAPARMGGPLLKGFGSTGGGADDDTIKKQIASLEAQRALARAMLNWRTSVDLAESRKDNTASAVMPAHVEKGIESIKDKIRAAAVPDSIARQIIDIRTEAEKLAEGAPKYAGQIRMFAQALEDTILQGADAKAQAERNTAMLADEMRLEQIVLNGIIDSEMRAVVAQGELTKSDQELADSMETIRRSALMLGPGFNSVDAEIAMLEGRITSLIGRVDEADPRLVKARDRLKELAALKSDLDALNQSIDGMFAGLQETRRINEEAEKPLQDLEKARRGIKFRKEVDADFNTTPAQIDALRAALIALREEGIDPSSAKYRELKKELADLDTFRRIEEAVDDVAGALVSAIDTSVKGVIQGTQTIEQAFANMLQSVALSLLDQGLKGVLKEAAEAVKDFLKELAKSEAVKAAIKGIGSFVGSFFGGTGSAGAGGGAGLGADYIAAGGGYYMAEGGIVNPRPGGTLITAGEAGQPEVILPLNKLDRYMPGGGWDGASRSVSVQIINRTSGPVEGTAETQMGPDGSQRIMVTIVDAVKDGITSGKFDDAMKRTYGLRRTPLGR